VAALLAAGLILRAYAVPPPAPWVVKEIGKQNAPGSVDVDARGLWTVRADSGDIYGNADQMMLVYQPLSGDGSIAATILGQQGGNAEWAKTGVHIRESDVDSDRAIDIHMTSRHAVEFQYRPVAKRATNSRGGDGAFGARVFPTSFRLQREGDTFTPFISYDGIGWTQVHQPVTIAGFKKDAIAGISFAANNANKPGNPVTAVFTPPVLTQGYNSPIVQATAGNGGVLLQWPPVANAIGYVVRRSSLGDPAFNSIPLTPTAIKETTFTDTNLPNDKPVRYLVTAVFDQGGLPVEGYATAITATPTALPANMAAGDINLEKTQLRGSTSYDPSTGVITISGSGGDIWDNADRCHFASIPLKGDFQITVKLLSRPGKTNDWSKAGLMLRESLDGPSRMAVLAGTQKNGVAFQWRDKTGGGAAWPNKAAIANAAFKEPVILRLVRHGNVVTAFTSTDGATYIQANDPKTFDPPLAETLYVGLAITSHNDSAITSATFSDLVIFRAL
jgi:ribosomal protein S12